jgi:hypothetical protein
VFGYSTVLNSGTTPTPPRLIQATNQTKRPITIGRITVSPSQFWIPATDDPSYFDHCSNTKLPPGHTCTFSVNFTASPLAPGATTQTWMGTVTVPSDAPNSPNLTALQGTGIAGLINLSSTMVFPNTLVGATTAKAETASLYNPNAVDMTIDSVGVTGDFSIVSDGCNTGTLTTPTTLPAKSSCTVTVNFAPTAQGIRTGTLQITSNARNNPAYIKLQGAGTLSAPAFSPKSLSFGTVPLGDTGATKPLTVTNTNTIPMVFGTASISSISGDYQISADSCSGNTISAGTQCTIGVTFKTGTKGGFTGALSIVDNAGAVISPTATQKVSLSGSGK